LSADLQFAGVRISLDAPAGLAVWAIMELKP